MKPNFGKTNPSPEEEAATGVRRFAFLVGLKPEKEQLYRELHANVPAGVSDALKRANVHNYSIFVTELDGKKYLVAYYEYSGSDLKRDLAAIAADPMTRDQWWPITDGCQLRLPGTPNGQQWLSAERLMHLP
jgi:L-rhamnose mutarotase